MFPLVIDLSHHNVIPESLMAARDYGVRGVIHKITEGSSWVDDKAAARYHLAQEAGLLWGGYHFLNEKSTGANQAKFFVEMMKDIGCIDYKTLVAADHEDTDAALSLLRDFLLTLRDLTSRSPVVYSGHVLKEQLTDYIGPDFPVRLWLAQYGDEAEMPNGFSEYWLWQYTDQGEIPGINGDVDLNHFDGTPSELALQWAGGRGF
jgi:lysozyme